MSLPSLAGLEQHGEQPVPRTGVLGYSLPPLAGLTATDTRVRDRLGGPAVGRAGVPVPTPPVILREPEGPQR